MPYKDIQAKRKYGREWQRRKRAGIQTRTKEKLSDEELRQHKIDYKKKWLQRKREEGNKVFGTICFLCGGNVNLCLHEKSGTPHQRSCTERIALKNPDQWVKLCYPCHKAVHWCMEHFKMSWEEIIERFV